MKEKQPLVSIIIPNYNYARYLQEAIDSALNQTYENLEVIVVDDGSTDDSREIIQALGEQIRPVLFSQNKGLGTARNVGIDVANGEFLLFLDSDDLLFPGAIADLLDGFSENPDCGVIFGDAEFINSAGTFVASRTNREGSFSYKKCLFDNPILVSEALVKKHVLNKIEGFSPDPAIMSVADYDVWIKISKHFNLVHIPQKITAIRKHASSMSNSRIPPIIQEFQMKLRHADGSWLTRKALAAVCHRLAYEYKITKQPALFRQYAWKAIRYNPTYWKNYAYLVYSFIMS